MISQTEPKARRLGPKGKKEKEKEKGERERRREKEEKGKPIMVINDGTLTIIRARVCPNETTCTLYED